MGDDGALRAIITHNKAHITGWLSSYKKRVCLFVWNCGYCACGSTQSYILPGWGETNMATENDWVFLQTALPDLQDYILSNEIYWTLRPAARFPGGKQVPQLTIGNLLLAQRSLSALSLTGDRKTELSEIDQKIDALRDEWRSNWSMKAGREFSSRLNLWQQYLRELRGEPGGSQGFYAREVRNRAILRLLRPELLDGVPANEAEQLAMLDQVLRGKARSGPFVWEPELASAFPESDFWFLYVTV